MGNNEKNPKTYGNGSIWDFGETMEMVKYSYIAGKSSMLKMEVARVAS